MLEFQQVGAVYRHLRAKMSIFKILLFCESNHCVHLSFNPGLIDAFAPRQRWFADLEDVVVHQDDGLEGGPAFVGQLVECFLFAPALLQQGVTHHTGRAFEARAEVEGDVRARLGAAAARQVHLKSAEKGAHGGWFINRAKWAAAPGASLHVEGFVCLFHQN